MEDSTANFTITCNGRPRHVARGTTVAVLVQKLGFDPRQVAVELDGRVLSREELAATELKVGARLELIRFVGGG
ncbi:sulfur carrier protein ThiS [Desulfurivibrio dismutans]|uniref:sulfur carrier protein ThiS n=1 Tax=Desulfurivibrio dismutans TaxID=1398908 RepID=UPI0023DCD119|nr:sulfur carrier protein ThiS [Desulfurivibrio alkaliphilus]MDF1613486.1 sulfur carrier protein ThiS [Desulfurivibrio alkaliphilus]